MKREAINPFLPLSEYIPDGEPHVFHDRVYLFGSHDKEDGDTFCMLDYEVWSAPVDDLSDWTSKGINYSARQDPLYSDKLPYMYAPDCVRGPDGRYYLYYCMAGWRGRDGYANPISVAVSDTPDGKYAYLGVVKKPDGTPLMRYACFDPAVMNDNGTIHLYYGTSTPWLDGIRPNWIRMRAMSKVFGRTMKELRTAPEGVTGTYHVTLARDMLTAISEPTRIDDTISGPEYKNHLFFEGSSIRKIGSIYYFIYSSVNNHELCYATSKRPDGSFAYGGTIVSNGDVGYQGRQPKDRLNHTGTNHGSIEKIGKDWYVFYHRLTHNSDYSRQACAERIEVLPDGRIPQVEMTSCGLNGGPLRGGAYPAAICCNLTNGKMTHGSNVKKKLREPCVTSAEGERYITGITDGTMIGYKYFALAGAVTLVLTVRGTANGAFTAELGGQQTVLPISPGTEWASCTCTFPAPRGAHPLYLRFRGSGTAELRTIQIEGDKTWQEST